MLLDKGVNPNIEGGEVYWIKDNAQSNSAADYVATLPLPLLGTLYNLSLFLKVFQLLPNYGATLDKNVLEGLKNEITNAQSSSESCGHEHKIDDHCKQHKIMQESLLKAISQYKVRE